MVDAIISFAVEKLGNILIEESGLPEKVRKDVEWLKTEFVFMQSFLNDVTSQPKPDNRAHALVSEVEAIANEAVDILDCKYAQETSKWGCIRMCGCIGGKEASLHSISDKIVSLKERVEQISNRRERYGINNIIGEGTSNNLTVTKSVIRRLRRSSPYFEEDELFVGFQDVLKTLIDELLIKQEPRRSIISIYGMGGLGKTTLARKLYNTGKMIQEFPNRAWLCVSQEFNILDLLRATYKSFKNGCSKEDLEKLGMMDEEDMERYLRDFLKDKKYLVVFDDVWDKEAWASIRRAFPDDKNGSRIIIATREKAVAEQIDDRTYAHSLRFLTTTESWDLFSKKISFGEGNTNWCSPRMLDLGRLMADKCGGLPLAIMTLGGLLLHKRHVEEWIKVKTDLWRNLKKDKIEIRFILSLSYDNLPKELEQCFLYLGLFPEDYMIDSERLMWLWMAEDFFPYCEGNVDDRAYEILDIGRSLIQVSECYRGLVISCKLHDLVRDLAIDKGNEVKFLNIYNPAKPSLSPRCAIHDHVERFISHQFSGSRVHSLIVCNQEVINDTHKIVPKVAVFKGLKILDLEDLKLMDDGGFDFPYSIGDLVRLKYLGVPKKWWSLPPSIGKLLSLQTLRAYSSRKCTFPREIAKLKNLRHLYARPEYSFQFSTLTSLRTLRYITHSQLIENDVLNLQNLRELAIEDHRIIIPRDDTLHKFSQLTNLQILSLEYQDTLDIIFEPLSLCRNLIKLKLKGNIKSVASLEKLPPSILMLTLTLRGLDNRDPMPILGRLPNLTTLALNEVLNYVNEVTCEADGFPELEFLYISYANRLKSFQLGEGSMPVLKGLEIKYCPNLSLPEKLRSIPPPRDFLIKSNLFSVDSRPYLS